MIHLSILTKYWKILVTAGSSCWTPLDFRYLLCQVQISAWKENLFGWLKKTYSKKSMGLKCLVIVKGLGFLFAGWEKFHLIFESIRKVSKLPLLEIPWRMLSHLAGCLSIKFPKRRVKWDWFRKVVSRLVFNINALKFSSQLTIRVVDCSARFTPVNMYSFS